MSEFIFFSLISSQTSGPASRQFVRCSCFSFRAVRHILCLRSYSDVALLYTCTSRSYTSQLPPHDPIFGACCRLHFIVSLSLNYLGSTIKVFHARFTYHPACRDALWLGWHLWQMQVSTFGDLFLHRDLWRVLLCAKTNTKVQHSWVAYNARGVMASSCIMWWWPWRLRRVGFVCLEDNTVHQVIRW